MPLSTRWKVGPLSSPKPSSAPASLTRKAAGAAPDAGDAQGAGRLHLLLRLLLHPIHAQIPSPAAHSLRSLRRPGRWRTREPSELVVTGVCVGAYGPETGSGGERLADVLVAVADIPGIERVRLSSVQPVEIPDAIIEAMASHPNIAPHLHLSLQSGDDTILRRMNRPYDTRFFADHVAKLRCRRAAHWPNHGFNRRLPRRDSSALFENTLAFAAADRLRPHPCLSLFVRASAPLPSGVPRTM